MKKISCVMSNYNTDPSQLRQAIECIINQTYSNFELIIIDDKSTNGSEKIIKEYSERDKRVRPIYNDVNKGLAASLNIGLRHSTGDYIARFDTDDWCRSDRFATQLSLMEKEKLDLCGSLCFTFGDLQDVNSPLFLSDNEIGCELFYNSHFIHSSIMMSAKFIREHGLSYSLPLNNAEDFDLWVKFRDFGANMKIIRKPLIGYRVHNKSVSVLYKDHQKSCAEAICREQLYQLASPTEEEWRLHRILCGFDTIERKDFSALTYWTKKLIEKNNQISKFEPKSFARVTKFQLLKQLMKCNLGIKEKMGFFCKYPILHSISNIGGLLYTEMFKTIYHCGLQGQYKRVV